MSLVEIKRQEPRRYPLEEAIGFTIDEGVEQYCQTVRLLEGILHRPASYGRGSWIGRLAYPDVRPYAGSEVVRTTAAFFHHLYGDRRAPFNGSSKIERFFYTALKYSTGPNIDLYWEFGEKAEAKAAVAGALTAQESGLLPRATTISPDQTVNGIPFLEIRYWSDLPFVSGVHAVFLPADIPNHRVRSSRRQEAMHARVDQVNGNHYLELGDGAIDRIKSSDEIYFTRVPERPVCKDGDEWAFGTGFRPTAEPAWEGTTAVNPWGSTDNREINVARFHLQLARALRVNACYPFALQDQPHLLPEEEMMKVDEALAELGGERKLTQQEKSLLAGAAANYFVAFLSAPRKFASTLRLLGNQPLPYFDSRCADPEKIEEIVRPNGLSRRQYSPNTEKVYPVVKIDDILRYLLERGVASSLVEANSRLRVINKLWEDLRERKEWNDLLTQTDLTFFDSDCFAESWDMPWRVAEVDYLPTLMLAFSPARLEEI